MRINFQTNRKLDRITTLEISIPLIFEETNKITIIYAYNFK